MPFRVILLSSYLSWGGRKYYVPVGNSISEFTSRVPLASEIEVYELENQFHSCCVSVSSSLTMCIIGVGLVYGEDGFDNKDFFRYVSSCL